MSGPGDSRDAKGPRVAVILGSGSVKCAAALGLLRVLKREGIGIDMIVGCSGGSLYAAMIGTWDVAGKYAGSNTSQSMSMNTRLAAAANSRTAAIAGAGSIASAAAGNVAR